jgi:CheY-like chemotaxis protein
MINVDMPILDGYEFLEHVQSLSNGDKRFGKDTKIYGLANNIEKIKKNQEKNKDRSCDFEDVIQKPVGLKKL